MGLLGLAILCGALIAGCSAARPPDSRGTEITVADAQHENAVGRRVRWGGDIVGVTPGERQTCFEVIERPLTADARPSETAPMLGRFVTCASGYYDPAIYGHGRALTVVGKLEPAVTGKIGAATYDYPRVAAEHLYLWPPREPAPAFYDPWTYPFEESFWHPWADTPWGSWW